METSVSLLSCRGGTANLRTNQCASLEVNADSEGNFQLTLDFLLQLRVVRGVQAGAPGRFTQDLQHKIKGIGHCFGFLNHVIILEFYGVEKSPWKFGGCE